MMRTVKDVFDEMRPGLYRDEISRAVESGTLHWGDPYDKAFQALRLLMKEENIEKKQEEGTAKNEQTQTGVAKPKKKQKKGDAGIQKKRISPKGIVAIAAVLFSAGLIAAAFVAQMGLPFSMAHKEPSWVQCKLLLKSDNSYDFLIAFSDEHDDPMTDVEGTGHLKITYESLILYDSDFQIRSSDYTREMPGDPKERPCAFILIPTGAVDTVEEELPTTGRARVDFTTKTGGLFQDIEFGVEVPHKNE